MDENNNVMPSGSTPESVTPDATSTPASTDYAIGGPTSPIAESAPEAAPAVEPTPVSSSSTADIYEKANSAAINPNASTAEETPIFTTSEPTSDPMASYSVPSATTYASSDSTYSNTTYSSSVEAPVSNGLAIASLICGILSIIANCCCCGGTIFSIAGIICGCLQKPMEDGKKPGMATAGIITSIVGIAIAIISVIITLALGGLDSLDY